MHKFDINEIRRRYRLKEKKDPTKTFIGGLIIGSIFSGLVLVGILLLQSPYCLY